jgi:hypothetical protein
MNDRPSSPPQDPIAFEGNDTAARAAVLAKAYSHLDPDDQDRVLYNDVSAVLATSIENLARIDVRAVLDTLDFALHHLGAGNPDVSLSEEMARRDAERWARMATPSELVAYGTACLRNVPDKGLHPGLLRTILTNIWRRLDVNDRRRFLERTGAEMRKGPGTS